MQNTASPVQDIKERLPIEQLIGEYLTLRPAGINLKAVCPFHSEKTPSFMVSPERRSWHCFGCDKGGDIYTFVMEMEGLEFKEALKMLAKKAGIELPAYRNDQASNKNTKLYEINDIAAQYFQKNLKTNSAGVVSGVAAQAELKKRAVDQITAETFKIGFAPVDWEGLVSLLEKRGFTYQQMVAAGVAIPRKLPKKGAYDRFRNRLMFPLVDVVGRVVGFSGRALDPNEKMGKYINSPETEIFKKSNFLYALNLAKTEIRKKDFVILVEGQMDVVSSHRVGVKNVVATSGTALTTNHLELIKRYTNNLVLAFDVDIAGASATKKGIDLALTQGLNVKIAKMPGGVDPDDLCRTDPRAWGQAINQSEAIIDYYLRQTSEGKDLKRVETKKNIAKTVLPEIGRLQDDVEKTHYLQKLSALVNVAEQVLREALQKKSSQGVREQTGGYRRQVREGLSAKASGNDLGLGKKVSDPLVTRVARLIALKLSATQGDLIDKQTLNSAKIVSSEFVNKMTNLLKSKRSKSEIIGLLEKNQPELLKKVNKELFLLEQTQDDVSAADEANELFLFVIRDSLRKELADLHKKTAQSGTEGLNEELQTKFVQKTRELARLEEQL